MAVGSLSSEYCHCSTANQQQDLGGEQGFDHYYDELSERIVKSIKESAPEVWKEYLTSHLNQLNVPKKIPGLQFRKGSCYLPHNVSKFFVSIDLVR